MNDTPADTLDAQDLPSPVATRDDRATDDEEFDELAEFDDLPDESELSEAELVAKLQRGMAEYEAGRFRPAKDVMREIAAEYGFSFEE